MAGLTEVVGGKSPGLGEDLEAGNFFKRIRSNYQQLIIQEQDEEQKQ